VGKMPEVMQVIVEALQLREQRAKHERARGDDAMRGAFDRLTKA